MISDKTAAELFRKVAKNGGASCPWRIGLVGLATGDCHATKCRNCWNEAAEKYQAELESKP